MINPGKQVEWKLRMIHEGVSEKSRPIDRALRVVHRRPNSLDPKRIWEATPTSCRGGQHTAHRDCRWRNVQAIAC